MAKKVVAYDAGKTYNNSNNGRLKMFVGKAKTGQNNNNKSSKPKSTTTKARRREFQETEIKNSTFQLQSSHFQITSHFKIF